MIFTKPTPRLVALQLIQNLANLSLTAPAYIAAPPLIKDDIN